MEAKLTRSGESVVLTFDRGVADELGFDESVALEAVVDSGQLVIRKVKRTAPPEAFNDALNRVNEVYGTVLKRLAE